MSKVYINILSPYISYYTYVMFNCIMILLCQLGIIKYCITTGEMPKVNVFNISRIIVLFLYVYFFI